MQVFWFKRDLRINDNEPLVEALKLGPVLPLYVFEPTLWLQPDLSYRHYLFLKDSINDLNMELSQLGQQLIIKVGPILKIFDRITPEFLARPIVPLYVAFYFYLIRFYVMPWLLGYGSMGMLSFPIDSEFSRELYRLFSPDK